MRKPPVTPIFPRSNGTLVPPSKPPENLPIRKLEARETILNSGGFNGKFNPEIAHTAHSYPRTHSYDTHSYDNPFQTNFQNHNFQGGYQPLNCISIAQHIDTCPICSRLYDTDKTLYILAIIGLLIFCFLMVKRIIKL
jgi:hypothetical protein